MNYLGGAYALLHPINFEEPFGLSIIESYFCGTPVIAFKRGSMPELILMVKQVFLYQDINEAVDALKNIRNLNRKDCRILGRKQIHTFKNGERIILKFIIKILK